MPILPPEPDISDDSLLTDAVGFGLDWFLVYTKSRQEKLLMRKLRTLEISYYGPQVIKRAKSPAGRIRTSSVPLFSNYVFVAGDDQVRYETICTGAVTKIDPIEDVPSLITDLRQIHGLISMDVPMTIEGRVGPGQRVRVRNGSFAGYEGVVERRDAETRLIVLVRFMEQGVSVKLDDCQVEVI